MFLLKSCVCRDKLGSLHGSNPFLLAGISVDGLPQMPIQDVTLGNVQIEQAKTPTSFKNTKGFVFKEVKINGKEVPAPKE